MLLAVYGAKGRLRKKFVISMKSVLDDLTTLAQDLRQSFPLHPDDRFGGISRMPAHLHLLYYQVSDRLHSDVHVVLTLPTDNCYCNETFIILLREEVFRIASRSGTSGFLAKDQTAPQHVIRSFAEDLKYTRRPPGSGPSR
jgi:hypothetical protein